MTFFDNHIKILLSTRIKIKKPNSFLSLFSLSPCIKKTQTHLSKQLYTFKISHAE